MKFTRSLTIIIALANQIACTVAGNQPSPNITTNLVNPAAKQCIMDGYQLKQRNDPKSLTPDFICFNPTNHQSCRPWLYYRGECFLN